MGGIVPERATHIAGYAGSRAVVLHRGDRRDDRFYRRRRIGRTIGLATE
jgi:hypothetical protein